METETNGIRSGAQQGYIAQIETGKRVGGIGTLKKLAAALDISLDDLASTV